MERLADADTQVIAVRRSDSTGACKQRLTQTLAAGKSRVVVDLSEITHIDDAMVSVLLSGDRICRVRAGRLIIVHPGGLKALGTSGLSHVFDIAPTRERALCKLVSESAPRRPLAKGAHRFV